MLALIWDFVSVHMIASLGGDNRPLACLLNPSFISQIDGDIKEPTPLFENSRGGFPGGVVYLNSMHHSYHGLWVGHSKLINELIAAANGAHADIRAYCWDVNVKRVRLVLLYSNPRHHTHHTETLKFSRHSSVSNSSWQGYLTCLFWLTAVVVILFTGEEWQKARRLQDKMKSTVTNTRERLDELGM